MSGSKVSIALDQQSLARFSRLLEHGSFATGAHCGDDDDDEGDDHFDTYRGVIAAGAHCGDDDDDGDDELDNRPVLCLVG